jgi:hypothetical protein
MPTQGGSATSMAASNGGHTTGPTSTHVTCYHWGAGAFPRSSKRGLIEGSEPQSHDAPKQQTGKIKCATTQNIRVMRQILFKKDLLFLARQLCEKRVWPKGCNQLPLFRDKKYRMEGPKNDAPDERD